jgi:hypothetical protein
VSRYLFTVKAYDSLIQARIPIVSPLFFHGERKASPYVQQSGRHSSSNISSSK